MKTDDVHALAEDLRLGVAYATRAGLLAGDPADLKEVFDVLASGADAEPFRLARAINTVSHLIAPLTFAELRQSLDPFSEKSQRRQRAMQVTVSVTALLVLGLIGFFMHALRIEQAAIAQVQHIAELKTDLKMIELRDLAEYDQPIPRRNALYEEFQRRISELRSINDQLWVAYIDVTSAWEIPLFPTYSYFFPAVSGTVTCNAAEKDCQDNNPNIPKTKASTDKTTPPKGSEQDTAPANTDSQQKTEECVQDADGGIKVQGEAQSYPLWMQRVLSETSSDFCFQLHVLFPRGSLLSQSVRQLSSFVEQVQSKVSLRVEWFLPFFYGVLGSSLFLMRNMASARTPTLQWIALAMRISLGGVAGIVIGWFAASATAGFQSAGSLSVPFALAFLVGYGIELLFTLLDRLNKAIAGPKTGGE